MAGCARYLFLSPTHPFLPYVAPHFSHISPFYSCFSGEHKSKGQPAVDAEVARFTRELQPGAERTTLDLKALEETALPQRTEGSDVPVMSNDVDARWVQCEHCFRWSHWMCAMYNETQYKGNRPYYCVDCRAHEPAHDNIKEAMLNNDADNLTQIPMGEYIEQQVALDLKAAEISCEVFVFAHPPISPRCRTPLFAHLTF